MGSRIELGDINDKFWLRIWGCGIFGIDITWLNLWNKERKRWHLQIYIGNRKIL